MPIDSTFFYTVVAVSIAGYVRGYSGFGAGMILVPALSLMYNPVIAVVTVVILELIPSVQLLPHALRHCHWQSVIPMSLVACVAIPLGSSILVNMDAATMRQGIALLLLTVVATLSLGWRYKGKDKYARASMLTGLSSGMMSGATGLGGLPVILFYLSGSHTANVSRASMIVFFVVSTIIALIAYSIHGIVTTNIVGIATWLAPVFLLATWFGAKMFGKVCESTSRKSMLAMLGVIGVTLLIT